MLNVNWKQLFTALKAILVGAGPSIIALAPTFGWEPTSIEKYLSAGISVVGIVLLILDKTDAAMVKDAKDIEGVQVHVDTNSASTPASVVKLAEGPMHDVFPMIGGPRLPTEHDPAATPPPSSPPEPPLSPSDDSGYKTLKG